MYLAVIFLCEQILVSQQVKADVTAEGSVMVSSEDVNMSGESTDEGTGLTAGSLRFGGHAHASGAVTIIGSTAPSHLPPLPESFMAPPPPFNAILSHTFLVPKFSPIIISPTLIAHAFVVPALAPTLAPKLALALAETLAPTLTPTLAPALAPALPPAWARAWSPVLTPALNPALAPIGLTIETVLTSLPTESTSLELTESDAVPLATTSDDTEDENVQLLTTPDSHLEDHECDIKMDVSSNVVQVASSVPFAAIVPVSGSISIAGRF